MPYVNIDIEIDEVWIDMSERERVSFIEDKLFEDGYEDQILNRKGRANADLENNAAYRLEVITWLRANGWTVEPK